MLRISKIFATLGSSLSQQSAVDAVNYWRSRPSHKLIFDAGRVEISRYLQAVDRLLQSANTKGVEVEELIATAMARLKTEFDAVLRRQADSHAGPASTTGWSSFADSTASVFRYEDYTLPDPPSTDEIAYLRNIAARMNATGRIGECVRVYISARKPFIQGQLKNLKFKELTTGPNTKRYLWDDVKVKMEVWIQLSKICMKKLFRREKQICDEIFDGIGDDNTAKDESFVETVDEFAVDLFAFVETMSMSNHGYERMETVLALYNTFLLVFPNVSTLFLSAPGNGIRTTCAETLSRIESEVGRMLYDFEYAVLHEESNVAEDRGSIDRLTEYVMDQINIVVRNRVLLTELIKSTPSLDFGDITIPQKELGNASNREYIQRHLILIIVVLQKNLKIKSQMYQDFSLRQLFIMNNVHYIFQKIEASQELQEMIGESYLKELRDNFDLAMDAYKKSTCDKFLRCFDDVGLYSTWCFTSRHSRTALKKKLTEFNSAYEETLSLHSFWRIPDPQLKEGIRNSLSETLVPEYRKFLEKFKSNPKRAVIQDRNVKYSAEDLENLVLKQLFADGEGVV